MSAAIFTTDVNGRPKTVVLTLYATPDEMSRGCTKLIKISRRNAYGFVEERNLEIEISRNAVAGTVYSFESAGDYLGDGQFQSINVELQPASGGHTSAPPLSAYNAWSLPAYNTAGFNQSQSSFTSARPAPNHPVNTPDDPNSTWDYFKDRTSSPYAPAQHAVFTTGPFQQLKVFRSGDYDISYLPNGDVAVQLRVALTDFDHRLVFRRILSDGTPLTIQFSDMNTIGIPEYKPRFFNRMGNSPLSGNLHLLVVSDVRREIDCSGCLCCV